jgi:hypothetical protein
MMAKAYIVPRVLESQASLTKVAGEMIGGAGSA